MGTYTYAGTAAPDNIQVGIPYENPGVLDVKADGKAGNDTIGLDYEYRYENSAWRGGVYSGKIELHGGSGNDVISHAQLSDYRHVGDFAPDISSVSTYYYGDDGNDVLSAASVAAKYSLSGAGNDYLRGGPGNDTYYIFEPSDKVTEASGGGYDTIVTRHSGSFGDAAVVLPANCEKLVLGDPTDFSILLTIAARAGSGNDLGNLIIGNGLDNQLQGAGGNDTIYGANASGFGGGDELPYYGLVDADTISGGTGNDVIYGGQSDDDLEDGPDRINADAGNDKVWAGGGDDVVHGGAGDDSLYGQSDNDKLYGDTGADMLGGGSGDDLLDGGVGNDTLTGREGRDSLYGGAGNDRFDYDSVTYSTRIASARDVIFDFAGVGPDAGDRIDLSTIDAYTGKPGNQTFEFIGNSPFSAAGQVRAQGTGTDTLIQANVTGAADAEMQIVVKDVSSGTWENGDFIL